MKEGLIVVCVLCLLIVVAASGTNYGAHAFNTEYAPGATYEKVFYIEKYISSGCQLLAGILIALTIIGVGIANRLDKILIELKKQSPQEEKKTPNPKKRDSTVIILPIDGRVNQAPQPDNSGVKVYR